MYQQLDPSARAGDRPSALNQFVLWMILVAVISVALGTEPEVTKRWGVALLVLDFLLAVVFSVEYFARLWVAGEEVRYRGAKGRLRYAITPAALIDLIAVVPFWIALAGTETFLLRVFRLLRIVSAMKIGRYSRALQDLTSAFHQRRHDLVVAGSIAFGLTFFSATALYLVEGGLQPEAFGSIPRAMWWAVSTLTTVGYGDVVPVTVLGKLFGGLTSPAAILILALPTGILAGAFAEVFRRRG